MSKGAILFAFNSPKLNYYEMAEATAKRINHFLDLPVTIVTDKKSLPDTITYTFDKTVIVEADKSNIKENQIWINKGRFQAYEFSPYDETLLLDTDYMVNSNKLATVFNMYDDFMCHETTSLMMNPSVGQELMSPFSFNTLWATVICFKKTSRTKQIFDSIRMVQENYNHYSMIHSFVGGLFRNDYALTLAVRLANGHTISKQDFIPWNLVHVGNNTYVYKNADDEFNTEYTIMYENWQRGRMKKEYITIKDMDFHVMDKINFMELIK